MSSENIVEVLDNGDVMFEGRLVSQAELIVGTVLCGLKKVDEADADRKEEPSSSSPASSKRRKYRFNSISLSSDDVRLTYTKTFYDAMNSADAAIVLKMLHEIATPNLVLVNRKLTPDPDFLMPNHFEVVGPEAVAASCAQWFIATPDIVVKVLSQCIHLYANGESLIECDIMLKLTKIFDIDGLPEGGNEKLIVKSVVDELGDKLDSVKLIGKIASSVECKEGEAVSVTIGVGASRKEKVHILRLKASMHLNTNQKIFLIINDYE